MKSTERKAQFGKVSEGDRDCFRRLGRANAAATRMEKPAGTLAEAIERMARIEGLFEGFTRREPATPEPGTA